MSDSPAPGVDGGNSPIQKMSEVTICTIMSLDILFNRMVDPVDLTRSLTVRMKHSILGTCYFLYAQFRFMPRAVIYLRSGLNSQSVCICVILKPRGRYNLCTCVIPSALFSTFRFLIILTVANMMCSDMVLRNPITLMCMRSQKMVTSLYLSKMFLGSLVILKGSTCWILRHTVLPFRCGMIVP